MSITLVAHTGQQGASNSETTGAINTTGASLLVIGISPYQGGSGTTVFDSMSNTWTPLSTYNDGTEITQLFYAANPVVGAGHTFSVSGSGIFCPICVAAFAGVALSSPFDVQNGNTSGTQTGSVTPTVGGALLIAAVGCTGNPSAIDSGFTVLDIVNYVGGQSIGLGLAYLIQTGAAAENPTWTVGGFSSASAAIATFKPAAAPAPSHLFGLLGTGV